MIRHPSPYGGDIAFYRTFVVIISVSYFTLIALSPRTWGPPVPFWQVGFTSVIYLVLGIWGFELAQRLGRVWLSLVYLLVELAIGLKINDMADRLFLAEGTVKNHVTNILTKLDVRDRTQAAIRARQLGLT